MKPKILVVDDEAKIREFLSLFLKTENYGVLEAASASEAFKVLDSQMVDLIVLDIMLPDMSGYEVCTNIRKRSDIPIIFLSALSDEEHQLLGYLSEADDYVTKPFKAQILLAKIKNLLKRSKHVQTPLVFKGITVNIDSRTVVVDGNRVHMSPKEYELLCLLLENVGKVLTREHLLEIIWGYTFAGESRVVDNHIKKLRKKISPYSEYIKTVISIGYKVEG